MSRYNPGLEAGIVPGNLRAFKKDGQRLPLYFFDFVVEFVVENAPAVAENVPSFDEFNTITEAVTQQLGDYDFGSVYEIVSSAAPDFAQFEQYLGADALRTTAEAFGPTFGETFSSLAGNFSTTVSDFIAKELPNQLVNIAKTQVVSVAKSVVGSALENVPGGQAIAGVLNRGIDKTAKAVDINSTGGNVFAAVSNAFGVTTGPAAAVPQGTAFDDEGNLNLGWTLREDGSPVFLGGGFLDSTGQFLSPPPAAVQNTGFGFTVDGVLKSGFALVDGVVQDLRKLSVTDIAKLVDAQAAGTVSVVVGAANALLATGPTPIAAAIAGLTASGISAAAAALLAPITPGGNSAAAIVAGATETLRAAARQQQTQAAQGLGNASTGDWRVRLSLAPGADYLYNAAAVGTILAPLKNTGGVIFPYTPAITTAYKADYEPYSLTHSNFKGYFYKSSYVDPINIKATFTAQDTAEANYLLAVIHFFRSVTKMFYGQDAYRGAPPPMVFLTGLGQYQFNKHPCVVASFDYSLPADVNYIRSSSVFNVNGTNTLTARETTSTASNPLSYTIERLKNHGLKPGAQKDPAFVRILGQVSSQDPPSTYVPTKIDINISLYPMQSRQQVSQVFSLTEFANGNLLSKGFW